MSERRLLKELRAISKELSQYDSSLSINGVTVLHPVSEDDLFLWRATIRGPSGTPYAGGTWDLRISVPSSYPTSPPSVRFENSAGRGKCSRMPHPNVNLQNGEICLDVLQSMWTPAWTLSSMVVAIVQLLESPEPLSPLNIDLANLLKAGDESGYAGLIGYYVERYTA